MALVVRLAAIVAQKAHRVALHDMLWMVFHEFLDAVPQGGNGFVVLVQAEHKTVFLAILLHKPERIETDITVELDSGLHPPVVFVVEHQRVTEEEAGLVATHVPVALRIAIDDFPLTHILANLPSLVLIDPLGIRPVLLWNQTIERVARHQGARDFLEGLVEGLVVEKHPVIVIVAIKAVLDLPDRFGNLPHVSISGQRHKGRINTAPGSSWLGGSWGLGNDILLLFFLWANFGTEIVVLRKG